MSLFDMRAKIDDARAAADRDKAQASSGADFSPCKTYRYKLWRTWGAAPPLVVIGLNPSTADEVTDDPTVRRCVGYAKRWGHGGLCMLNLFAFRSTDPRRLRDRGDPIGPLNDTVLVNETLGRVVLCAWGAHGRLLERDLAVLALIGDRELRCLGRTKGGMPKHPLYLPLNAEPIPFGGTR